MDMSTTSTGMAAMTGTTMTGMTSMTGTTMTGMAGMTTTGTAAMSTGTSSSSMSGMSMSSSSSSCKISMLWNWNTIDACFISHQWHITSKGMFAGSCIGVILLVMMLELLRRSVKEYDRFLLRQYRARNAACAADNKPDGALPGFRPNIFQQAVRAFLHMCQFAVAYFVMLLAMYYNGYIIICIFIGAFIGSFVFQWETMGESTGKTSAANEATVCCG